MFSYLVIACFLGVAAAAPYAPALVETVAYPKYGFNYAVNDPLTGDNKAQSEVRDGGVVKGSYSLAEPDGTIRVVDYAASPLTGFNANVKRIGPAVHPPTLLTKQVIAAPIATSILAPGIPLGLGGLNPWALQGLQGVQVLQGLQGLNLGYKNLGLGLGGLGQWGY